jgi:hypothetical protein
VLVERNQFAESARRQTVHQDGVSPKAKIFSVID